VISTSFPFLLSSLGAGRQQLPSESFWRLCGVAWTELSVSIVLEFIKKLAAMERVLSSSNSLFES
jgi:hypothetical protein